MTLTERPLTFVSNSDDKLNEYRLLLDMPDLLARPMSKAESSTRDLDELVREKCEEAAKRFEPPLFVEHTALEISALDGYPGVLTQQTSAMTPNARLLDMMVKETGKQRAATARIAIGYLPTKGAKVQIVEAKTEGYISTEARGTNGFGWDEIFMPEGESKTYAEMTLEEKNRTSMRARVGNSFKILLRDFKATPMQPSQTLPAEAADDSRPRPPEGPWQAFTSIFWPKRRWARSLLLFFYLLIFVTFVVWASLPDSKKDRIIERISGQSR